MGNENSTKNAEDDLGISKDLVPSVNKKIPKKRVVLRKIVKKDKVINFLNIPLFVSDKDPGRACDKLCFDLDQYEVQVINIDPYRHNKEQVLTSY